MDWRQPKDEDSVPLILENSHLTDEALENYCLGLVTEETELSVVEEHLLYCGYCQERLEKAQELVEASQEAARRLRNPKTKLGGGFPGARFLLPLGLAAALALTVLVPRLRMDGGDPVAIALASYRDQAVLTAPAGKKLALTPATEGLEAPAGMRFQLVNASGAVEAQGDLGGTIQTGGLSAGRYWLRLNDKRTGELLREFALEVR